MKNIRKIYDSKIFWLIVSFLVSLSVWVYVTSVETVQSTKTFRNVQVDVIGEDTLLNSRNMVVTEVDPIGVTVEIRGPRRVVNALESEDLLAQVDVSRLTQAAYTSLNYTIVYPSGTDRRNLTVVSRSQDSISFMVSKLTEKQIPVLGGFEGRIEQGYTAETPVFEPSIITISGPETYLKNIHHAYVSFGAGQTVQSTFSVETSYELQDSSNEACPTTEITSSPETIQATLPILAMKEVPLTVGIIEGAGATEANTRITVEPKSITLAGDSAILSEINQITLDTIDLTQFASEFTASYNIPIPNGLMNITGATEANVTVQIVGLETKTLYVNEFVWTGLGEGQVVEAVSGYVPVLLRGPSNVISVLQNENIRAEADLSGYQDKLGNYIIALKITVPDYSTVGAIRDNGQPDYTVAINLERETEP